MTFKSIDFDADEAAQYLAVGETMAAIYCDDEILFGPIEAPNWPEDFSQLSQEEKSEKRNQHTKRFDCERKE